MDVGIAEEHAAATGFRYRNRTAGSLSTAVYSTFYTAYLRPALAGRMHKQQPRCDKLYLQASVYGMSDVTHLGLYDIPMLSNIPNLVYLAPATKEEYLSMLDWAIEQNKYPVAVRVPGGAVISDGKEVHKAIWSDINKYEITKQRQSRIAVIALGTFYQLGELKRQS